LAVASIPAANPHYKITETLMAHERIQQELWSETLELLAEDYSNIYALPMAKHLRRVIERHFRKTYGGEEMDDDQLCKLSDALARLEEFISIQEGNDPDPDVLAEVADRRDARARALAHEPEQLVEPPMLN
jgi:hypothetical protein